jgi:dUTP pyrophosphatase
MEPNHSVKVLRLCVDSELVEYYQNKSKEHNESLSGTHPNSGFDLAAPLSLHADAGSLVKVDFKIQGAMYEDGPIGYYLYARSSVVKTGFRLANSVGIIDSGYRGNLMAFFDVIKNDRVDVYQRLVQICAPDLKPFKVEIVDSLDQTERGDGGFGSTGV